MERLLVAFSGGPDSVYLVHHLLARKPQPELILMYLDHQLRAQAELKRERRFVRDFAATHGLKLITRKIPVQSHSKTKKISIETAARELRYKHLFETAKRLKIPSIATGHHLDDVVETFFFKILRGVKSGALGISEHSGLVRPLLSTSKSEILDYLKKNKIGFSIDSTNADLSMTRNRIRHSLIPLAEKINPQFRRHIAEFCRFHEELTAESREDYARSLAKQKEKRAAKKIPAFEYRVKKVPSTIYIGETGQTVSFSIPARKPKNLRSSASTAFLNFDAFRGDIVVRNRRDGDRFQPFGMSGSKKLKEYLIDKKIPLSLRSALPLFFDQDRLAWIAGYQLSETYRVTPETRRVLRIQLTP